MNVHAATHRRLKANIDLETDFLETSSPKLRSMNNRPLQICIVSFLMERIKH